MTLPALLLLMLQLRSIIYDLFSFSQNMFFLKLADEELWEDLIHLAKAMIQTDDHQQTERILQKRLCSQWPVKQVQLRQDDWHLLPHTGPVTAQ